MDIAFKLENPLKLKSERQERIHWDGLLRELTTEVKHLNNIAREWVPGADRPPMEKNIRDGHTLLEDETLYIDGQQVMHSWQRSLMAEMADAVRPSGSDVLEIGYGLGIAAQYIQRLNPKSHTIIECNPAVYESLCKWAEKPKVRAVPVRGDWDNILPHLGKFDSIFFDSYPYNEDEYRAYWLKERNFAGHFFSHAAEHLREGGAFTYFSNEIDSLSREHQRRLFNHFSRVETRVVKGLEPPADCQYWWAKTMVVVSARK